MYIILERDTVSSIDGSFKNNFASDEADISCANCRFDVLMTNGRKIEFKSYKLESVNGIAGGNIKAQHRSYLEAGPPIEYIFEAGKLRSSLSIVETVNGVSKNIPVSAEEYVRHQFLQMYKNNMSSGYFTGTNAMNNYWTKIGMNSPSAVNALISGSSYKSDWLNFIIVK